MVRRIWLPFFIAWMLLIVPTALAANEAEDFEQFMNKAFISITLLVFQIDISGKEIKEMHS